MVIGGGPGGYAAALYAGSAGLSVAVVEKEKVGGTCLHRGCIPAKEFLETATVFRSVAGAKEFGVQASQPTVDFAVSQARKQKVVDQLFKGLSGLMKRRGNEIVSGTGTLTAAGRVRMEDGSEIEGRHVILATGSAPRLLPGFELGDGVVMTSDEVLSLERLPGSVVIVGGGVIGCEFASMMSDLGTQVTLLEALPTLLPGCDADVVAVLARSFKRRGVDIHTGKPVSGHRPNGGGSGTTVGFGEGEEVNADAVVVAVGRRPLVDGLLEDGTGVEVERGGFVRVDGRMRTTRDGVYAVGDLVNTPQLAHVAFAEAIVAVKDILGEPIVPVDYEKVPLAIYCHPEVAYAGLSEQAARDAGHEVVAMKDPLGGNSRARILGETDGLVKIIAERRPDGSAGRLLGVHMIGPWVTEQLGQGYLSVNWEATVEEAAHFVQPHPSLSEAFGETLMAMTGRGLHVG